MDSALIGVVASLFSGSSLVVSGGLLLLFVVVVYIFFSGGPRGKNPFQQDHRRPPEPFVHDPKLRDVILKDRFKPSKVPDNLDAVIIGSGAGGLTTGVLLTQAGLRVLVLEQHDQAGGACHSFVEKGFEFDTGIHYVGELHQGASSRILLDHLTNGQLRWSRLDEAFDTVAIGKSSKAKLVHMKAGKNNFFQNLVNHYPGEQKAILAYEKLVADANDSFKGLFLIKLLPYGLVRVLINTGLYRLLLKVYRKGYASRSVQQVLDELTDNKELKLVLSYACGDYGVLPKEAPWILHASLTQHYVRGAYYPANGTSEIAYNMIRVIQQGGGRVLVQAPVSKILCDSVGRAVGVRVGKNEMEIRAKYIVSDAGVVNTFRKLLPESVARTSYINPLIEEVGQGFSFMTTFVGIEGSSKDFKLPAGNIWLYETDDISKSIASYLSLSPDDIETADIPFMFISFPSAKDPEWEAKYPGKSSALIITLANWQWFKEWKDESVRHRGDRYEGIKDALGRQCWQKVVDLYPQLDGKKVYMEVGTPVTNSYYLASPEGEMYGLHQGPSRFSPDAFSKLRADTDIKGLYLTGQDSLTVGFLPALYSGILCASKILNRNVYWDLVQFQASVKKGLAAQGLDKKEE